MVFFERIPIHKQENAHKNKDRVLSYQISNPVWYNQYFLHHIMVYVWGGWGE